MLLPSFALPLPSVATVEQCAFHNLTVEPFYHQLFTLPGSFVQAASSFDNLKHLYLSTNPLITGLAISLALAPIFFVISEINRNYSQVDRVWSILPTFYHAHYALWAHQTGQPTARMYFLFAFGLLWSSRLTFNYWRKGGYNIGSEDYRWEILQKHIPRAAWIVFNITFISTLQSLLLFSVTMPDYLLLLSAKVQGDEMTIMDYVFAFSLMGLVIFEFFADGAQWNYYEARTQYRNTAKVPRGYTREELDRGFNTTGLFRWSRHPNFAAEQAIWVLVYQWGCFSTMTLWNWTCVGAISYLCLFQGSTIFTEWVSAGKYPEYKEYKKQVAMFVPTPLSLGQGELKFSGAGAKKGPANGQATRK